MIARYWLAGLMVLLLLLAAPVTAKPLSGGLSGDAPISITADRLEANDALHEVRFIGNVVAKQGDVAIYAGQLALVYPQGGRDIERVEADGDVRIVQGKRVATGQKAVFFNKERKIVLTGSPKVYQGDDFVEGDEITVYLDDARSIVKSNQGSRVNAVFHPRGERP